MLAFLRFLATALAVAAALFAAMHAVGNDYVFYAGYTVLQYVVLAVAWNILGVMSDTSISASRRSSRSEPTPASHWESSRRFRSRS